MYLSKILREMRSKVIFGHPKWPPAANLWRKSKKKVSYWSEMARNTIKSDFRSSKMGGGGASQCKPFGETHSMGKYTNSSLSIISCVYVYIILILSPAGAVGPGTGDIATPASVCLSVRPSVTFSFRTATPKRIAVFSRNFAGTCTKSWGCAV